VACVAPGLALVVALCVAALTAIAAIAKGDVGKTDVRVIATSLGFAVFTETAAARMPWRGQPPPALRALGVGTTALSVAGFLLLQVELWRLGDGARWRWFDPCGPCGPRLLARVAGGPRGAQQRLPAVRAVGAGRRAGPVSRSAG
jgi:hypothetical protein